MIKSVLRLGVVGLLAGAIAVLPAQLLAQSTNKVSAEKKAAPQKKDAVPGKQNYLPYKGDLTAIDKTAKTITVGKRVIEISSETKFFKGGKPAVLGDGTVGEYLTLSYWKSEEGKFIAHNVYWGGKDANKGSEKKKEKSAQ
jgi:hypothetical protein